MRSLFSLAIPAFVTAVSMDAFPTLPSISLTRPVANGIVAGDDGTLYFADGFNRTVWRLDRDGAIHAQFTDVDARSLELDATGEVHVRRDAGPAVTRSSSGDLLVAHGSTLLRVGADGAASIVAPGEPLLMPRPSLVRRLMGGAPHLTGIAVSGDGAIYVANASRGIIVRVDPHGRASLADRCGAGWSPAGLAVVDGAVFVLENGYGARVRRIGSAGRGVASWVRPARPAPPLERGARVVL